MRYLPRINLMKRSAKELWLAFIAILLITLMYLYVVINQGSIPAASDFFGHSLGVLGFTLMLMTETLYSRRKRSRQARWGRMSAWLQFHIFTGLVGPYMVFLHTAFNFKGLAGVVLLLTALIVISGFFGRYIYTAIPRTVDGTMIEAVEMEREIEFLERSIETWLGGLPDSGEAIRPLLASGARDASQASLVLFRGFRELRARWRWRTVRRQLGGIPHDRIKRLEQLVRERRWLRRQIASIGFARRLLGLWHTVHVPIGVALFTTATVHIVAAIYYASLLR